MSEQSLAASFRQGDSVDVEATIYEDKGRTTPKNMSGATGAGVLGDVDTGQTVLASGAMLVVDGPGGVVRFPFTKAQTAGLDPGYYDFQGHMEDNSANAGSVGARFLVKLRLPDNPAA